MTDQSARLFTAGDQASLYGMQHFSSDQGAQAPPVSSPSAGPPPLYVVDPDVPPGVTLEAWRHTHPPVDRPGWSRPLRWLFYRTDPRRHS